LDVKTLTERDSPIYKNNDVELFIAGKHSYYEFEINAFNTIYEVSGTLIFLDVSLIFTFQPRTSARAGQRANPERKSRRAGGLTGFAQ